jgi:hypothetical protein
MIQGLVWLHIVCVLASFGGIFVATLGLSAERRADASLVRALLRWPHALLGLGFVAGLAIYMIKARTLHADGAGANPFDIVIGVKFLLLLAVGACLGIASGKLKKGGISAAHVLMRVALLLLAVAAYLGVGLFPR